MVRELSKHQSASCLIVVFVIVRFASLSCYSSAKTRIQPVKSYHMTMGRTIQRKHLPTSTVYVNNVAILLLKALQRSFKMLFPCTKISDDENKFGKCVTISHQVNGNLDQLVTGKVVAAVLHQAIVFLEKRDG